MIPQFYILGSDTERPKSSRSIFADGSADDSFRPDVDLELSHWVPNRTPTEYKADTSTEICLNYVANPSRRDWDLALNNHQDVDGILSVFSLVHSELALKHRETVRQAAEMADFWAWGNYPAQILFQGLTLKMNSLAKADTQQVYAECLQQIPALLEDPATAKQSEIQSGIAALQLALDRITSGQIERSEYHSRFVHYHLPQSLTDTPEALRAARRIPSFNELLSPKVILPPQARNYHDKQKVQLVSIATPEGCYFDLYYPGYSWAETPDSWRAPGLTLAGSINVYFYSHPALNECLQTLNKLETAEGEWLVIEHLTPFTTSLKKKYPVIVSFMKPSASGGLSAAISQLAASQVASILAEAFRL